MSKFWFVNLGKFFEEQRTGSFIWAPISGVDGPIVQHWENMTLVNRGDIIFCNRKGNIMAVAVAKGPAYSSIIPDSFAQSWRSEGRRIDLDWYDLKTPFHFNDYKDRYLKDINYKKNPFDIDGNAKQGYLFPMELNVGMLLVGLINDGKLNHLLDTANEDFEFEIEEIVEENEQTEKINNGSIKSYSEEELEEIDSRKYKYEEVVEDGKKKVLRVKTDPRLKATRIELAGFICEINSDHRTFTNAKGSHQYLECHHIIPLNAQKDFPDIKLDSLFNIIALCPICHSQVHYASSKEKSEIFSKMFLVRKKEMLEHGFDLVKINEIFEKYYLKK